MELLLIEIGRIIRNIRVIILNNWKKKREKERRILGLITANEMYSTGQSLEHVSWVAERVDGEEKAHHHHEQAD